MNLAPRLALAATAAALSGCSRPDPPTPVAVPDPSATSTATTAAPTRGDDPVVLDLAPSGGPLKAQIAHEHELAGARTFIVQTTASWCPPCIGLKKYMGDPLMKDALRNVRLARIDIDSFSKEEIEGCELSASAVPWLVKLDAANHPVDAITSNEWGDDVPANMAPVLGAFVKGTFANRKKPWKPGKWL